MTCYPTMYDYPFPLFTGYYNIITGFRSEINTTKTDLNSEIVTVKADINEEKEKISNKFLNFNLAIIISLAVIMVSMFGIYSFILNHFKEDFREYKDTSKGLIQNKVDLEYFNKIHYNDSLKIKNLENRIDSIIKK